MNSTLKYLIKAYVLNIRDTYDTITIASMDFCPSVSSVASLCKDYIAVNVVSVLGCEVFCGDRLVYSITL